MIACQEIAHLKIEHPEEIASLEASLQREVVRKERIVPALTTPQDDLAEMHRERDASVNLASSSLFVRPFHCMLRSLFLAVAAIVHCNLRYAGTSELADEAWSHERSCFPIQHALDIYDQQPRRRRLRMVICRKGNVFTNMSKREGIV